MKLVIDADALKALLKLPRADSRALREKLTTFAADPGGQHPWAKNFGGGKGRVRHGDWRALYQVDGGAVTVTVVKVGHRREIYR
ncbi:MAG: type II toxin-antitoxin system RelE/ParE family toxin [Methanobacterium sp.]|nr:type II toxin-antitoxin system RelE/ParE family toxin [Methanobacterium sp.]